MQELVAGAARNSPEWAISCSLQIRCWLLLRHYFIWKSKLLLLLYSCLRHAVDIGDTSDTSFRFVISGMTWTQCTKCYFCLPTRQCRQTKPYIMLQVLLLAVFVDLSPCEENVSIMIGLIC